MPLCTPKAAINQDMHWYNKICVHCVKFTKTAEENCEFPAGVTVSWTGCLLRCNGFSSEMTRRNKVTPGSSVSKPRKQRKRAEKPGLYRRGEEDREKTSAVGRMSGATPSSSLPIADATRMLLLLLMRSRDELWLLHSMNLKQYLKVPC
jgi:hypothetical protein